MTNLEDDQSLKQGIVAMISDKQRRWWDEVDDIVVVFEFSDHPHKN